MIVFALFATFDKKNWTVQARMRIYTEIFAWFVTGIYYHLLQDWAHPLSNKQRPNERANDRPTYQTNNKQTTKPLPRIITGFYTGKMCNTNTVIQKTRWRERNIPKRTLRERENSLFFSLMKTKQNMSTTTHRLTHSHLALCNNKLL